MSRLSLPPASTVAEQLKLVAMGVLVGTVAAYGALGFIWAISAVQELLYGFGHDRVYSTLPTLEPWRVVLAPVIGGALVGVAVWRWMPGRRNYGPADAIEAVHLHDGRMRLDVALGSAALSAISIGAGASVGRYGPAVHLGASVSAWLAHTLGLDRAQRLALMGAGVASAIAASFNAPLAGVVFAGEVLLGGRALRFFIPIIAASVMGTTIARLHVGEFSIFSLSDYQVEHVYEYPLFAVTGVLGGLLAVLFMRSMDRCGAWAARSRVPAWARPVLAGALIGVIALRFPHVVGLGDEAIRDAMGQLLPVGLLLTLVALKLVATSLSLGLGFSGGVFGPALFLGAMMGSAFGNVVLELAPEIFSSPAIHAVAGMGAVAACVTGAPVATILIAFELTGSYPVTTAVMLAVVFAGMTTRIVFPLSYFKLQLHNRGVDVESGREVQILRSHAITEVTATRYPSVGPEVDVASAEELHLQDPQADLMVVDERGRLLGHLSLFDLVAARRRGEGGARVGDIASLPALVLSADMSLYDAMEALRDFVGISVPVVRDHQSMELVGVIYENAVIEAYHLAVGEARREERGVD